jgi:GT2 family glycosyltransferase
MEDHIGFVILHYLVIDKTIQCINSIKDNIDTSNYDIIIVDNFSRNETGIELKNKYIDDERVHVILNQGNFGFSKGNNVGYRYAKYKLNCNFIIMLNNDIVVMSKNIYKSISEAYKITNAAVIGPRIYTYDDELGIHNPMLEFVSENLNLRSLQEKLEVTKRDSKIAILLSYINLDLLFYKIKRKFGIIFRGKQIPNIDFYEKPHTDYVLHGCIWIFTPLFIKRFEGLREITFMYNEEIILYLSIKQENLITYYDPAVKVLHAERVASEKILESQVRGRRIRYKRELESIDLTLKFLKNENSLSAFRGIYNGLL